MISTVIGGAMLPHAPQFFTQPETEDKSVIAKVQRVAKEIGDKLKALEPDLWIIFSNDHAEQFLHNAAPRSPFGGGRGDRRICRPQVPLVDSERDRFCSRSRTLSAKFRSCIFIYRQD